MAEAKKAQASYGNESISALKGADRVRKRPGVIFGSDGLEGCEHAVFEILSNSIDEAGRALAPSSPSPASWTTAWRWRTRAGAAGGLQREGEAVELGAGVLRALRRGQVRQQPGGELRVLPGAQRSGLLRHPVRLRLHGRHRVADGYEYQLHFKKGKPLGKKGQELQKTPLSRKRTGTRTRWLPDLEVFTDIDIPAEYFTSVMKRQAVVNAGVTFRFKQETARGSSRPRSFSTRTASLTTSRSWRGRTA